MSMSELDGKQVTAPQCPVNDDKKESWKAYWEAQGQPWRTEPEIDEERQKYLAQRRAITPDIKQGSYPFKDITLGRADVEWLLTTHENERGPVDWDNEAHRRREGLDLRGANLQQVDLSNLPLARIRGGLSWNEWNEATEEQRNMAAVCIQGATLRGAHLEGARLRGAHLERTNLKYTYLEKAQLRYAHLERVDLSGAFLNRTDLYNAIVSDEKHIGPQLVDVYLSDVNLAIVKWSQVKMLGDEYEAGQKTYDGKEKDRVTRIDEYEVAVRANRQFATALQTQGLNEVAARFAYRAQICQKYLLFLQLMQSLKQQIKIEWLASLLFIDKPKGKQAEYMIIQIIFMLGFLIYGFGLLLITHLPTKSILFPSNINPSIVLPATIFGIVFICLSVVSLLFYFIPEVSLALFFLFMSLIQIAIPIVVYILLNTLLYHLDWFFVIAAGIWAILFIPLIIGGFKFDYWFSVLRKISNYFELFFSKFRPLVGVQIAYGRYIFAWVLDLIAGYGYRPGRSIIAYVLIIVGFASLYTTLGHLPSFPDSFVFSVASFHGRGFFPNFEGQKQLTLSDPLVVLAAIEAVIGLIIEISFIATFTQRYFGK